MVLIILVLSLVVVVLGYIIFRKISRQKPNAFMVPILSDPPFLKRMSEDDLIKNSYRKKKIADYVNNPKKKFDTIIIGSGLSGLSCASMLSQEGKKVLVLEQNEQLGGYCHSFEEEGFHFECGVHYLPTMHDGSFPTVVFDKLSEGKIKFKKFHEEGDPYDILKMEPSGKEYNIYTTKKMIPYLKKLFPKESASIDKYFTLIDRLMKAGSEVLFVTRELSPWMRKLALAFLPKSKEWASLNSKNIHDEINRYFKDEDLKRICSYMTYLAGSYKTTPFVLLPFVWGAFCKGVCYPAKPGQIPRTISRVITKFGGKCFVNVKVGKVLVKGNVATGVQLTNGDKIYAKHIVSTTGLLNSYSFIDKKFHPKELASVKSSLQCFYVFLGFDRNYKELGFPGCNYLICRDFEKEEEFSKNVKEKGKNAKFEPAVFFFSFHNHLLPEKSKTSQCIVMFPSSYGLFERWKDTKIKQRGNEYEDLKGYFVDEALKVFYKTYPKSKGHLTLCLGGSPLSTKHYVNWPKGEMYGSKVTKNRLFKEYDALVRGCKVKNYHISGTDSFIHCGVIPASITGITTAGKILKRDFVRECYAASSMRRKIFKRVAKEN